MIEVRIRATWPQTLPKVHLLLICFEDSLHKLLFLHELGLWMSTMTARDILFGLVVAVVLSGTSVAGSVHVGHPHVAGAMQKWGTHTGHVSFYNKMIAKYNRDPKSFSQRYQLMTKAIRNPAFNQAMLRRLLVHPARFIRNHPCFSRFLDGELTQSTEQSLNPSPVPVTTTAPHGLSAQGLIGGGVTSPSNPIVPEPSSMLLLGTAAVLGVAFRWRSMSRARGVAASLPTA